MSQHYCGGSTITNFEIQDFISKFTVQVLDWGDQILTNITGWFAENTKNLSTWTKMFESLIKIYNNFNLLLEVFVDFFDKCDDCKTREDHLLLI